MEGSWWLAFSKKNSLNAWTIFNVSFSVKNLKIKI